MRGTVRRASVAGLATVALAVGLTSCTGEKKDESRSSSSGKSDKSDKVVVQACENGTFTWTGVKETYKLTGVTQMQSLGDGGGKLTERMERVYSPQPSVEASGPAMPSAEVLFSLGKKIGEIETDARTLAQVNGDEEWTFTDVNVKPPALDTGTTEVDGAGEFVVYAGVREVTGDFSYTCPDGTTTTGQAGNWTVDSGGILDCDEAVDTDLGREAARRSCEEGSVAIGDA